MEAARFISLLKRQRFTIICVPAIVMAIAFLLMRNLPNIYSAKGTIAAGVVDGSQPLSLEKNILQDSKISQQFSNLIQMMQMKKVFDQVSYKLIIHDLTEKPFKKPSKLFSQLNTNARNHALDVYMGHYLERQPLSLWDADQKGLNEVINSMGYGFDALMKKFKIYRIENSDFITIEFESDSPTLSAFVVNSLADEFIKYYFSLSRENEVKAINYLDTLMEQKKDSLNNSMNALKKFKIEHHVLNLNEQARTLYTQISELEGKIEQVNKEIEANQGALEGIKAKFSTNGHLYTDTGQVILAQKIVALKTQISSTYDDYTRNKFEIKYLTKIDSLKSILEKEINKSTDKTPLNPETAKQNLLNQKMNIEISLDLAKSSVRSLQNEYVKLKKRFDTLVPNEAVIQSYEGNINMASQEYIEVVRKYNQTSMAYSSSSKLKQIEMAMPGAPLPSKKILLIAISGIVSFVLCMLVLFILFYLDESIQVAAELANKTNVPVLGFIPTVVNAPLLHLNRLWEYNSLDADKQEFKNLLRSVRFETEAAMNGSKFLVVTSLGNGEGKSFLSLCLANAYVMVNKKVLLIDGNFGDPSLTDLTKPRDFIEDVLTSRSYLPKPGYSNDVTILGNRGADTSLFEVNNEEAIRKKFADFKETFDLIIVESAALNKMNQAKEWIIVADKVLAVFKGKKAITPLEKQYIAYLKAQDSKFIGWILNKSDNAFSSSMPKFRFFRKKTAE